MAMNVQQSDAGPDTSSEDEGSEAIFAEINITPLTDVFLVLLIIFMVTSTAIVESEVASRSGVKVALPKSNAAGAVTKRRTDPVLTVTKSNELYIGSRRIEAARLEEEIRNALAEVDSETLLLRGDKSVFLGAAVDLMAVAKRAGAKNIAILTQTDQKP
jgi:biopolymer transport protein ExbD